MKAKWGQHFLRDEKILKKIADFAQIEKEDTVVEIGPGEGELTKFLLQKAGLVIAVEKDVALAGKLKERFNTEIINGKLKIITGDILKLEAKSLELRGEKIETLSSKLKPLSYILIGNIPYYITGEIFRKFLQSKNSPKSLTFVVQKEVGERIMARNGKESILSISIKAYGTPEYGGIIKAGSFSPRPKVDSAIIAVRGINKKRFKKITPPTPLITRGEQNTKIQEKRFFEIVKRGFAHKRKLLASNLGVSKGVFDTLGLPEKVRAEDLSVDDWFRLVKELS